MLWRKGGQIFILGKPGREKGEKGDSPHFLSSEMGTVPFFPLFPSTNKDLTPF